MIKDNEDFLVVLRKTLCPIKSKEETFTNEPNETRVLILEIDEKRTVRSRDGGYPTVGSLKL